MKVPRTLTGSTAVGAIVLASIAGPDDRWHVHPESQRDQAQERASWTAAAVATSTTSSAVAIRTEALERALAEWSFAWVPDAAAYAARELAFAGSLYRVSGRLPQKLGIRARSSTSYP